MIRVFIFAFLVHGFQASAFECANHVTVELSGVRMIEPLPDREYDTEVQAKATTIQVLAEKKQIFSLAVTKVHGSTRTCSYVDETDQLWLTVKRTAKNYVVQMDRAFSRESKRSKLSIFENRLLAETRFPHDGLTRRSLKIRGLKFFSDYKYHYSCGFMDCTDEGYEPALLAIVEQLRISPIRN